MPVVIEADQLRMNFERWTRAELQDLWDSKRGKNRTLNMSVVKRYRDMVNNDEWRWYDRAQTPMLIDNDGYMRSFQHRAYAFLMSDKNEFIIPVVRNASEEEIANQDNAYNRTFVHYVEMFFNVPSTVKLRTKIIPASRIICALLHDDANPKKVAEVATSYSDVIAKLENLSVNKGFATKYAPVLAAFMWSSKHMKPETWEQAFSYFEKGEHSPNPLLLRCREQLISGELDSRRSSEVFLKTVCALKATHLNKTVGKLIAEKHVLEGW